MLRADGDSWCEVFHYRGRKGRWGDKDCPEFEVWEDEEGEQVSLSSGYTHSRTLTTGVTLCWRETEGGRVYAVEDGKNAFIVWDTSQVDVAILTAALAQEMLYTMEDEG